MLWRNPSHFLVFPVLIICRRNSSISSSPSISLGMKSTLFLVSAWKFILLISRDELKLNIYPVRPVPNIPSSFVIVCWIWLLLSLFSVVDEEIASSGEFSNKRIRTAIKYYYENCYKILTIHNRRRPEWTLLGNWRRTTCFLDK